MNGIKSLNWKMKLAATISLAIFIAGVAALLAAEKAAHGHLGVSIQHLGCEEREELGVKSGVIVTDVEKESPAAKAGIKEDDVIQICHGEKVRSAEDLIEIIREQAPGTAVKIALWRDGKTLEVTATLDEAKPDKDYSWKMRVPRPPHMPKAPEDLLLTTHEGGYLGVNLQDLDADLASYFDVKAGEGALIINVLKETAAVKAGLKSGDVIVQMGEKTIKGADDVREALVDLKKGESVAITFIRHGKKDTLKAEPEFDHHSRIIRIRPDRERRGHADVFDFDIGVPEIDMNVKVPDMECIHRHFGDVMERARLKISAAGEKLKQKLSEIGEDIWI